jgi:hypothetical protein
MSSFSGKAGGAGIQIPGAQTESLRCGWTDSPANRVSCLSNIPKDVVTAAWRRELAWDGVRADRLFRFAWQNGIWLAYGLKDGDVRGVRCPSHRADHEARPLVADSRVDVFLLYECLASRSCG